MKLNAILITIYLAGLLSYVHMLRSRGDEAPLPAALTDIPLQIAGYTGVDDPVDQEVLDLLGADETIFREYRREDGPPIWVFLGYFSEPRENSQIHSPKHCYPGSGWSIFGESRVDVPFGEAAINANCLLVTNGVSEQAVFYWFHTDTGIVTNEFELKWVQMKNTLLQRSRRSTFVRFSTLLGEDRAAAEDELREFIDAFGPFVTRALDGEGDDA